MDMKEQISQKKYISLYIDRSIITSLKMYSAKRGIMRYSMVAEWVISQAYKEIADSEKYSDLKKEYKKELTGFINLKKGRPSDNTGLLKDKLTLYLSSSVTKYVYRTSRKFQLSVSGASELLIRIGLSNQKV